MGKEGIARWIMYQNSTKETAPAGYICIKKLTAKNVAYMIGRVT